MQLDTEIKLDYNNVLLRPKRSTLKSRSEVNLERSFSFRNFIPDFPDNCKDKPHYTGIPVIAANMDGVGTFEMADVLSEQGIFTCLVKTYTEEELTEFYYKGSVNRTNYVAMSIGTSEYDFNKLVKVHKNCQDNLKYVCIDIANGYSEHFVEHVRKVRKRFPHLVIIAGNVVTREMTEELILAGADIVKIGIGSGAVCTTRLIAGTGYPQLSAVIECADAAHGLGGHIIADGGCTTPGDVAKAFAAGADFVMLGSMLAGTDQGGGEIIRKWYKTGEYVDTGGDSGDRFAPLYEEKLFVQFYGMSSETANDKHFGGLKDYRSSEGRTVLVPYRGSVADTVQEILGGVRSAMTYCGASKLKNFSKCATFIRCNQTHNSLLEKNTIGN